MNLNEAFKALDSLNEDIFDMSDNGLSGLSDFMNDDIESEDVQIIDPEATTEDELADSYVGKVILDCSVCHSKIYKNKDEVTLDEEGVLANVGEDCPYCYTSDGFKVVGEVVPFDGDGDSDEDDAPSDGEELPADDDVDEGLLAGDVNVNLDARGFGGKDNNVSVLGSGLPESKEGKLKEGIFRRGKKKPRVSDDNMFDDVLSGGSDTPEEDEDDVFHDVMRKPVPASRRVGPDYNGPMKRFSTDVSEGIFNKSKNTLNKSALKLIPATELKKGEIFNARPIYPDDQLLNDPVSELNDDDYCVAMKITRTPCGGAETDQLEIDIKTLDKKPLYGDRIVPVDSYLWVQRGASKGEPEEVKEGIFDSKATKEKNYKAAIKKAFEKDFVIVAQEISGLAQTLASHAIDSSATTEQNAKKIQPMLANIEGAIKKPRNFDVISTLMNYGRKYADDDVTVEKLKEYFDASMRLRRTEKIGQKAYEYFQMKLADAVLKKLSSFRKYLKKEYGESYDRQVNENIQDLSMTANDTHFEVSEDESGTVTVTASPATADGGEQIAPVSDELEGEITSASEDGEDGTGEEDSIDIAIDEVDEGSLDELGEAYLTNVYGNVKSFRTDNVSTCGNKFIVEGTISFNTGKMAKTSFILESHSADRNGNVSFVGGNAHFSNRRNAYTLNGSVVRGKFIAESLDYNYMAVNGKNKVGVKGTATKKVQ